MSENRVAESKVEPRPHASEALIGGSEEEDAYPTFRDGPVPPHRATGSKPTDVALPLARRTYAWPAAIVVGLALLVALGFIVLVGGEAVTEDPVPQEPPAPTAPGPLSPNVEPTPGPIDVPG
jgi:hypothetical protein